MCTLAFVVDLTGSENVISKQLGLITIIVNILLQERRHNFIVRLVLKY